MSALRRLLQRMRAFLRKREFDGELDAELAAHLELAIDENLDRGLSPAEARRQALVHLGGVQQAREEHREARGLVSLDILLQDFRYTFRTLARDRAFAIVAVLILAVGLGANVAVFSVVNTLLLRPLPFAHAQRLVWIANSRIAGAIFDQTYSVDAYEAFRRDNHTFQDVTAYNPFFASSNYRLTGRGEPQPVSGVMVVGNFFEVLGIQPALGRLFLPEESQRGGRRAVLLSYDYWQRQFNGKSGIVGQSITLNDQTVMVAGVLPSTFDFGSAFHPGLRFDVFLPLVLEEMRDWGDTLALMGRLKPGITMAQAQAEANLLAPQLYFSLDKAGSNNSYAVNLTTLQEHVTGKLHRSLMVLWCAVGLILLIVCVNLSNLMLLRATARGKEFAMRAALGASRGRLMRQLLVESLVLSGAGAVFGFLLASLILAYLTRQNSLALPLLSSISLDGSALVWTLLVAVATAVLFGLMPALKMSGAQLQSALKASGQNLSAGHGQGQTRATLVVVEVALACVLLTGAGLLFRSFLRILDVDLGFEPSRASALTVEFDDHGSLALRASMLQEILRRVQSIPGVEAAGIIDLLPLDRSRNWGLAAKGRVYPKEARQNAVVHVVTPGLVRALGLRLEKGRDFTWGDWADGEPVVVINQTAAQLHWPGLDPVGRMAVLNGRVDARVIGVMADIREKGMEEATDPQMLLPATQWKPQVAEVVVRTSLPISALAPSVMRTLRQMNPNQPATRFRPLQQLVDHAISPRRFFMLLVTCFAALGLLLAALGIYGVISSTVTQQTQEIGIRMALGAGLGRVQREVLARTLRLTLAGVVVGSMASLALARLISSMLFATSPWDRVSFLWMVLALGLVALISGYLPARRAARIDPMLALRAN